MKRLLSYILSVLLLATPANAASTQLGWSVDKTVAPYNVGVTLNQTFKTLFTFDTNTSKWSFANNSWILPYPSSTSLGGVRSASQPSVNQFMTGIGTDGVPTFADVSVVGAYTSNDCVKVDTNGKLVSAGAPCGGGGGGSGTVSGGAQNQIAYYPGAGTTTTVAGNSDASVGAGALSLGNSGSSTGSVVFKGTTSGSVTVKPSDAAGTYNYWLPTTAGTTGQVQASAGGSGPMTWTTLSPVATSGSATDISTGNLAAARIATALTTPGPIGSTTPNTGAFTTLTSTGAASFGTGTVASTSPHRVTATGNLTNGSATITNLSPAASTSWIGWEISGTGISSCQNGYADSARAIIISVNTGANTITMFCPATATATASTLNIGRDFYSSSSNVVARTIGAESALFGDVATNQNASWMNQYFAGWGGNDPQTTTGITVTPPNGGTTGIIIGANSSTAASQRVFGTRTFIATDGLPLDGTYPRTWAHYGVNYALAAADNVQSQAAFMEAEVYNGWTARDKNPYTTTLGVVGDYQAGCGAGSGGNPCSYAFLIFNNGAKFLEGIVFNNAALDTSLDGTYGYAIHMGTNQALHWSSSSGTDAGNIASDGNDLRFRAKTNRTLKMDSPMELSAYTVSTVPTCDTARKFSLISVSDLNMSVATYKTSFTDPISGMTGGGTTAAMFFCDGVNWRLH